MLNRRYESRSKDVYHEEGERKEDNYSWEEKIWNFQDSRRICGSHDEYEWNKSRRKGLIDLVRDREKWKKKKWIYFCILLTWITVALIVSFSFTFLIFSPSLLNIKRMKEMKQSYRDTDKNERMINEVKIRQMWLTENRSRDREVNSNWLDVKVQRKRK